MHSATVVQLKRRKNRVSVWEFMAAVPDIAEYAFKRVTLSLSEENHEFLGRLAAYRNAMAKEARKNIPAWTRKSLCEAFISAQADTYRKSMAEMFAALGELPSAKDREALKKYVARVAAWDKKTNNQ